MVSSTEGRTLVKEIVLELLGGTSELTEEDLKVFFEIIDSDASGTISREELFSFSYFEHVLAHSLVNNSF